MSVINGRVLLGGSAHGEVVYTGEPLSFWGGYDAKTGEIIDTRHELFGANVAGKVFVLPGTRGSSTGSGILLESIRVGTAPAVIILARADPILALGAIVARELYGKTLPLLVVTESDFAELRLAKHIDVDAAGRIEFKAEGEYDHDGR